MDIMKYKLLFELPSDVNSLRKKHGYVYNQMRLILKELNEQGLVETTKSKGVCITYVTTETGNKVKELLTEVYKKIENEKK